MSNIFLKNELNGIFDTVTESNVSLPQWVTIVDKANNTDTSKKSEKVSKTNRIASSNSESVGQIGGSLNSATSSEFVGQLGGIQSATSVQSEKIASATSSEFVGQLGGIQSATSVPSEKIASATSSEFVGQLGGAYSATSTHSTRDVNKLISMLTSESSNTNFKGLSETSTASLEEQLREILNQDGGAKMHKKTKKSQKGGANEYNVESVKQFFTNLKNSGVNVDVKLNNKTLSEFFAEPGNPIQAIDATTTELISETSDNNMTNINNLNLSATSVDEGQVGGAGKVKKSSKKGSKKSSKKGSKKALEGGVNAGFQAFLDLKKYIAQKLGVSNGPIAAKVAGAVQKDMKEKYPEMDAVSIAAEGRKHFDKNTEHYKQMLPK
jgi:hypothetical protein